MKISFLFVLLFLILSKSYSNDWPIYKGNLYFTGNNDEIIVKNNSLKWLYMASNYIFNPIVSDGKVYFSDLDKIVYCLDEETGRPVWKWDMKTLSSHFASAAGVGGKVKYPIIRGNSLFISDATAIYCLDKLTGRVLWARAGLQENDKNKAVIDGIYADPILSGDNLYYGTRKNFIAREIVNGHVLWSNPDIESFSGFPTYYDDKILSQSRDFKKNQFYVFCMDQNSGKTLWQKQLDNPPQIFSPVVFEGKVYIPSGKKLYCLSITDGSILWAKEYTDNITSQPGFTDREILFNLGNEQIAVVDPENGSMLYTLDFGVRSTPYYVTVKDQIYIANNYTKPVGGKDVSFTSAKAFRFDDKSPVWEFQPPFPGGPSQPVASKGVLLLPAGNYLYAIGTYYEKPITFGNDGNTAIASTSSSASSEWNDSLENVPSPSPTPSVTNQNIAAVKPQPTPEKPQETPQPEKPVVLDQIAKGESVVVPNIYFEFNQAYLKRESIQTLDNITAQLKRNPRIKLEIRGHTDNVGEKGYNQRLSKRRADSVMDYFIKNGVSPERLKSKGFGMDQPVADNNTEAGRAKNRRTEFLIIEK